MGDQILQHLTQLQYQQKPPFECRESEQTCVRPERQNRRRVGGVPEHEQGSGKAESTRRQYLQGHQRKTTPNRRLRIQAETARVIFYFVIIFFVQYQNKKSTPKSFYFFY